MSASMFSMGYVVTKLAPRPAYKGDSIAKQIVSMSDCLTSFLPGPWVFEWTGYTEEERRRLAEGFGLEIGLLKALSARADSALADGALLWPNIFRGPRDAASFLAALGVDTQELWLLGLGVHESTRTMLLRELASGRESKSSGVVDVLGSGAQVQSGGETLGWEILGVEDSGQFHSWLCNDLEVAVLAGLGSRPGRLGLLETERAATEAMDFIARENVSREPVPWFAGAIRRYSLGSSR